MPRSNDSRKRITAPAVDARAGVLEFLRTKYPPRANYCAGDITAQWYAEQEGISYETARFRLLALSRGDDAVLVRIEHVAGVPGFERPVTVWRRKA